MRLLALSLVLLFFIPVHAQRTEIVEGSARICFEDGMTSGEVRQKAIEMARMIAIGNTFGTNVAQNVITTMNIENGITKQSFNLLGESDLRGIWIRDVKMPKARQEYNVD
ncbi:MAG: hypothetical protein IJ614_08700 [Prevotella sp.]|nr:hypothetical protein [Prevotella sp.]